MGYLPQLQDISSSRDMAGEFRGYNHNYRINPSEFYDMYNMTGRFYPVLSPRKRRGVVRTFTKCNGIHAHDKLCWVDGTDFYYDGALVPGFILADSQKTFVNMGALILIWPDKKYYNTADGTYGDLGCKVVTSGTLNLQLCKADATDYQAYTTGDTAPTDPTDGQLWMNTGVTPHVLMQYSVLYLSWQAIPTTYIKISGTNIGKGLAEYDGVTISGASKDYLNGNFIIYGATDDFIVITGTIDETCAETATLTIERKVPDMDFMIENENRIWGCSSAKHEIYACKQGDPKNWYSYLGTAVDSYAATVGSTGDFTGCSTQANFVLFFKEDEIIKIYGTKPSNYQLTENKCRGVEKGSEKSLLVVNETLYYKSAHDICAYSAAQPTPISEALGPIRYKNAVAGAYASVYYICLEDERGNHSLFAYDEKRNTWHKEDDIAISGFASCGRDLYFQSGNKLYSVDGNITAYADSTAHLEDPVAWHVETGDIGMNIAGNKYVSKLQFRLEVPEKSLVRIEVQYDSDGQWLEKYRINATRKRSFTVPIIPRRCDNMRIRILGIGDCKIYSLTKTIEEGSDI